MAIFQRIPVLRWMVPAAAVVLIVAGSAVLGSVTADASTDLPARSAAQLLADVQQPNVEGLSGTVVQTSDLGIPDLSALGAAVPGMGGSGSSDLTSLVSGTHTLRLWYAGPTQVRVALLGSLGESDVIRNGQNVWMWSSKNNAASHWKLKADATDMTPPASPMSRTPQQVAAAVLSAVGPTTTVSTTGGVAVAGRSAYELVLQPKDSRSLVAQVRIAIDAAEHVPLRVQIFAVGQAEPAFQVAFTSVDFAKPDAAQFAFNPPPGATVTEGSGQPTPGIGTPPVPHRTSVGMPDPGTAPTGTVPAAPQVVGTGWTQVLVIHNSGGLGLLDASPGGTAVPAPTVRPGPTGGPAAAGAALSGLLNQLPTESGSWGTGHLLTTKLFSVLLTDTGTVAMGAVPPSMLSAAIEAQ